MGFEKSWGWVLQNPLMFVFIIFLLWIHHHHHHHCEVSSTFNFTTMSLILLFLSCIILHRIVLIHSEKHFTSHHTSVWWWKKENPFTLRLFIPSLPWCWMNKQVIVDRFNMETLLTSYKNYIQRIWKRWWEKLFNVYSSIAWKVDENVLVWCWLYLLTF